MSFYLYFTLLLLFLSVAQVASSRHLQQRCPTTTEDFPFSGLFLIEFEGQPGLWTQDESDFLRDAVIVAYSSDCTNGDADPSEDGALLFDVHNVTVTAPESFRGPTELGTLRNFSLPVFIEGRTNLTLFEGNLTLFRDGSGPLQGCDCPQTKEEFLDKISRRLRLNTGIVQMIVDIHETVPRECPGEAVQFSSGMAMESVGIVDGVDLECLQTLSESVASLYNFLNILDEETCDPYFREVRSAFAVVDDTTIRLGGGGESPMGRRILQDPSSSSPSSSFAPSVSNPPSSSVAPSTVPTISPTSRGPDLFAILLRLEGTCRGCESEINLFDDIFRKRNTERRQQFEDSFADHNHGRGLLPSLDGCYCSPGATMNGGPTEVDFFTAWRMESVRLGDDLSCIDSVRSIEEIRVFDCGGETVELISYLQAEFQGDLTQLTEAEILALEATIMELFEELESRTCDPFVRSLLSVRTVRRGLADRTATPSMIPSTEPSMIPSTTRGGRRKLQLGNVPSGLPSGSSQPSSSSPSLTKSEPTSTPTSQPTSRGPDLFFLVFELTGQCRGCTVNQGLFNQLLGQRRRRKLRLSDLSSEPQSWKNAGSRQLEGEDGTICGCGLEAPEGGVTEEEFVLNLEDEVGDLELPNVEGLEGVEELNELPSENPTESVMPSSGPSQSPRGLPSESPSGESSLFPSEYPSDFPVLSPSLSPSGVPSQSPSTSPSTSPSHSPSGSPSGNPSQSPSGSPSVYPSQSPSTSPSGGPSQSPIASPSGFPSQSRSGSPSGAPSHFPSGSPSGVPSLSPSTTPSNSPTKIPECTPATTGSEIEVDPSREDIKRFELDNIQLGDGAIPVAFITVQQEHSRLENIVSDRCDGTTYSDSQIVSQEFRLFQIAQSRTVTISIDCPSDFRLFMNINVLRCDGACLVGEGSAVLTTTYNLGLASFSFDAIADQPYVVRFELVNPTGISLLDASWIMPDTPGCGAFGTCDSSGMNLVASTPTPLPILSGGSFTAEFITPPMMNGSAFPCPNIGDDILACEDWDVDVSTTSLVTISMPECPFFGNSPTPELVNILVYYSDSPMRCAAVSSSVPGAAPSVPSVSFVASADIEYTVRFVLAYPPFLGRRFIRWGDCVPS